MASYLWLIKRDLRVKVEGFLHVKGAARRRIDIGSDIRIISARAISDQ
jgi:hypothetical protein